MSIKYWLDLYAVLIRSSIRSRMQYKLNFMLGTVLAAVIQIAEPLSPAAKHPIAKKGGGAERVHCPILALLWRC